MLAAVQARGGHLRAALVPTLSCAVSIPFWQLANVSHDRVRVGSRPKNAFDANLRQCRTVIIRDDSAENDRNILHSARVKLLSDTRHERHMRAAENAQPYHVH